MIPKRMYFFWSGDVLSWMRYMTLYSFRKFNPNWEMILCLSQNDSKAKSWSTNETQDFFNYTGASYFNRLQELNIVIEPVKFPDSFNIDSMSPIHESDLYRYYKLYNDGGFYSDMDILYFRSMENFYNEITQSDIDTILYYCPHYASIGFLGAKKDNVFYKDLMLFALSTKHVDGYQSFGVELIYSFCNVDYTHRKLIDSILKNKYKELNIYSIPEFLVYYYGWEKIQQVFSKSFGIKTFNPKSIGYHWYAGGVESQKYNKILNENNYMEHKTTFSEIVKELQ